MTSKDKTIRKIEFLKAEMKEEQEQYGRNSLHTKLKLKYLEDVLKDLEILDMLRYCIIMIGLGNFAKYLNLDDYNMVEEWITNEN